MLRIVPVLILFAGLFFVHTGRCETILFKNGDEIKIEDIQLFDNLVAIDTENFGLLFFTPTDLTNIIQFPEPKKAPAPQDPPKKVTIKKEKSNWSGQVSVSRTSRDSNTIRQRNGNIQEQNQMIEDTRVQIKLRYKQDLNTIDWSAKHRFYRIDDRKIDDQYSLSQNYRRDTTRQRLFLNARTLYQQDYRRALDFEFLQSAEVGIQFKKSKKLMLSTSLGIAYHLYQRTIFSEGEAETSNVTLPKAVLNQNFRWEIIDDLVLIQGYRHQGDLANYQFNFSAGVENRLIAKLFLKLEYKIEEDTEVAYDDRGFYNRTLLASLIYKF